MTIKNLVTLVIMICALGVSTTTAQQRSQYRRAVAPGRPASQIESLYTELGAAKCKTVSTDQETGSTVQRCNGVGGYKLMVLDDDARQSVTVLDPSGKEHPLNFWGVVTGAFSSVGEQAEWRVTRTNGKVIPVALIIRVNANEYPDDPNRVNSYLAVAKITSKESCVVSKIGPGANSNAQARRAADSSASAPCLKQLD